MKKISLLVWVILLIWPFSALRVVGHSSQIPWTAEELNYLEDHPIITLGVDPEFVPFEFISEGEYQGIASDFVELIENRTGIDFQVVPNLTWAQAYYQALAGDIDVLPAVSKTAAREEFFLFSDMYYEIRRVIITLDTNTSIRDIEDLYGRTVAVQINSSHHSFLLDYPEINLSLYTTVTEGLNAVSEGSEVAFIGNLATSDYLIKSNGITNLRFSVLPSDGTIGLHFAVQKDNPVLLSIINKSLDTITTEERVEIFSHWVTVTASDDYGWLLDVLIGVLIVFAVAAAMSSFWIFKLRSEIAKRKQIQIELEAAKGIAEEANRVKSSFLARMSHEIRTPLNAITGMSYLLKKSATTPTHQMYSERISQASQTMLGMVNDILDFSKIEANKIEIEAISFNLDDVIRNLLSVMSIRFEEKNIGFHLLKDPAIPSWFIGDPKRLEQVFINLLNNAVKFTSQGSVTFAIKLTAKEDQLYHLEFHISDTGIGMSKSVQANLFTPFSQADATISRRYGGTGLGLSIVKGIIELMGGSIRVFSTEGEGSTFIIQLTLPMDELREKENLKESANDFLSHLHVLVVEKNTSMMNIMETYLRSFGMECELTTSPSAALSLLESSATKLVKPFDLLIVDYEAPSEKAFQWVSHLLTNLKGVKVPKIIVELPMSRMDLFDQLELHHIDSAIGKPIIPSLLHNAIIELFVPHLVSQTQALGDETNPSMQRHSGHIMVVDDNSTNQMIAKILLEQAGFEVLVANHGQEALDLYAQHASTIHLVLMDVHMPVMDGYQAASKLHEINPDLTIVAMTAEVVPGVQEKCRESGMMHYISKPFDPEHFVTSIQHLLQEAPVPRQANHMNVERGLKLFGGNKDTYRLVLSSFAEEMSDLYERLTQSVKQHEDENVHALLHQIKGSSGNMAAQPLYELCLKLYPLSTKPNWKQFEPLMNQLLHVMKMTIDETRQYLTNPQEES